MELTKLLAGLRLSAAGQRLSDLYLKRLREERCLFNNFDRSSRDGCTSHGSAAAKCRLHKPEVYINILLATHTDMELIDGTGNGI